MIAIDQGNQSMATGYITQLIEVADQVGNLPTRAYCLVYLGVAAFQSGDLVRARELLEEGMGIYHKFGWERHFERETLLLAEVKRQLEQQGGKSGAIPAAASPDPA